MELKLKRVYHEDGVNGVISLQGKKICESIELPDKDNERGASCIPEGKYHLRLRTSAKYGEHLEVLEVPDRLYILIHPANNAMLELRGCIAPVLKANSPGKGVFSRKAMAKLMKACKSVIEKEGIIYLNITS